MDSIDRVNTSVRPAAPPPGEITSYSLRLEDAAAVLRGKLQGIEERLESVMRHQGPAIEAVSGDAEKQPSTQLGSHMESLLKALNRMSEHAQSIADRIEL